MKKKLTATIIITLMGVMLTSTYVFAEPLPSTAPDGWDDMSGYDRVNWFKDFFGGSYPNDFNRIFSSATGVLVPVMFVIDDEVYLGYDSITGDKSFMSLWEEQKAKNPNIRIGQMLVNYTIYKNYGALYDYVKGVKTPEVSDYYVVIPELAPDYVKPEPDPDPDPEPDPTPSGNSGTASSNYSDLGGAIEGTAQGLKEDFMETAGVVFPAAAGVAAISLGCVAGWNAFNKMRK